MIGYAIDGDLRFISHHDTIRLFERALARAAFPVRFSEGFNPRPRLSLPLPRPVGIASEDETLIVDCTEPVDPDAMRETLSRQMPAGIRLRSVRMLEEGRKLAPTSAVYRLTLDHSAPDHVRARAAELMSLPRIEVRRRDHESGAVRQIDIRPGLIEMSATADGVEWRQAILQQGTARPGEMLEALGLESSDWLHCIRRVSVEFA